MILRARKSGEGEGHLVGTTRRTSTEISTTQKIKDLDAHIDAINTGENVTIIVVALIRQIKPPFTERVIGTRVSSNSSCHISLGCTKERLI